MNGRSIVGLVPLCLLLACTESFGPEDEESRSQFGEDFVVAGGWTAISFGWADFEISDNTQNEEDSAFVSAPDNLLGLLSVQQVLFLPDTVLIDFFDNGSFTGLFAVADPAHEELLHPDSIMVDGQWFEGAGPDSVQSAVYDAIRSAFENDAGPLPFRMALAGTWVLRNDSIILEGNNGFFSNFSFIRHRETGETGEISCISGTTPLIPSETRALLIEACQRGKVLTELDGLVL